VTIAALVLWLLAAGAGVALLSSGNAARRRGAALAPTGAPPGPAAVPLAEDGSPPPGPHTRVVAPSGEHPLLEFSHPALAITGLAFWLGYALVRDRALAWISLGVLLVTLAAGISWLARNAGTARRRPGSPPSFAPRLILVHGVAAAAVLALTVVTALSAGHG
jgi:hypothetical protein